MDGEVIASRRELREPKDMLLSCAAGALAFYILSALFFDSFVIIFVVTVLLAALDFWVVKNVSGRILVGLRWWNEIDDNGESVWKFECLDQEVVVGSDEQEGLMAVLVDSLLDCGCMDLLWNILSDKVPS
ncbi:Golgi apparatus membrane protein-like protein ECHIDNA [Tanacetum coccineum]